jgi:quinol monooxygenase YgiN
MLDLPEPKGEKTTMVHLIAFITAQPGKRDELLAAFRSIIPTVHAEHGCIEYAPVVDLEGFGGFQTSIGPDTYLVVEKWASPEALRAHASAPHMAAYGDRTKHLIAGRVLHVLTPA